MMREAPFLHYMCFLMMQAAQIVLRQSGKLDYDGKKLMLMMKEGPNIDLIEDERTAQEESRPSRACARNSRRSA